MSRAQCTSCFLSHTSFTMCVNSRPSQCSSLAAIYITMYTVLSPATPLTLTLALTYPYTHPHSFTLETTYPNTISTTSTSDSLYASYIFVLHRYIHAGRESISKRISQSIKFHDNEFQRLQSDFLKLITRYFCGSRLLLLLWYVP